MKIAICYPPLNSPKGRPLLSQNRQFQWFTNSPVAYSIYPVIMAQAATLLKESGHQVAWLDGIAKNWSPEKFLSALKKFSPDLVVVETKTPVVKIHWKIIGDLKSQLNNSKFVLVGDHVSALPKESLENSKVDYILTGGDYDFALLNLVQHLEKKIHLAGGVWFRQNNKIKNSGSLKLNHNLGKLPMIDRELTCWQDYAYRNSNFYRAPGAYTMFARDCWWGKCSFCSWAHNLYPKTSFRTVSPKRALDEIGQLVSQYHVKEIMDDSGTFPTGDWLRQFCQGMIRRGYQKKIKFNCNMRLGADLSEKDYRLMGRAGFRFILYGLESASQKTLDKINKGLKVGQIEPALTWATKAGLMPHVTVMIGYPWETENEIKKTLNFIKNLFQKGLIFTMQATIIIPYPGTPLFIEAKKKAWLKTTNWSQFDMRQTILKTKLSDTKIKGYVQSLYTSFASPQFIWRTIKSISGFDDIKYIAFQGLKFVNKKLDFKK